MGCVYVARNVITGMSYVGKTKGTMVARKANHEYCAMHHKGNCRYLYAAIRKYGADSFAWTEIFHGDDEEELLFLEQRIVSAFRTLVPNGYNLTRGGRGCIGYKASKEARSKLATAMRNRPRNPEAIARQAAALRGRKNGPHSAETRRKIGESNRRRVLSAAARANMSAAQKRRFAVPGAGAYMAEFNRHRVCSPETRAKISANSRRIMKEVWAKRKAERAVADITTQP